MFILSIVKGSGVPQATPFWTDERGVRTYGNSLLSAFGWWLVALAVSRFELWAVERILL